MGSWQRGKRTRRAKRKCGLYSTLSLALYTLVVRVACGFAFDVRSGYGARLHRDTIVLARKTKAINDSDDDDGDMVQYLKSQMQQQQRQIDSLLKLVTQLNTSDGTRVTVGLDSVDGAASSSNEAMTSQHEKTPMYLAPCKVMVFIDGTWLYYSLYERREQECPIIQKFGRRWQARYNIDWEELPRIICENIPDPGWTSGSLYSKQRTKRPLEVVRVSVFTSFKADTSPNSWRYQMFQDMKAAKYDLHMMETVGKSEKCVDIQLAVEMLHYSTVPDAYDIAVLVTGDKDFMPAMIRTRQKGRKVGLVSMRRGCNRALVEAPGLKDFDVVWLEDYLDQWIKPNGSDLHIDDTPLFSKAFFARVIANFIFCSGLPRVSSRDLGRYLKFLKIPGSGFSVLDELKAIYGGLSQFLNSNDDMFTVTQRTESFKEDSSDMAYWVTWKRIGVSPASVEACNEDWNSKELDFFRLYTTDILLKQRNTVYYHTFLVESGQTNQQPHQSLPPDLTRDYSQCTLKELRDRCRERGLLVSGLKSALLERVLRDVEEQIRDFTNQPARNHLTSFSTAASPESIEYLTELVMEYVKACGGSTNSRDVGRYLAANKASAGNSNEQQLAGRENEGRARLTALQELKDGFGNLGNFVIHRSDVFVKREESAQKNVFWIDLRKRNDLVKNETT